MDVPDPYHDNPENTYYEVDDDEGGRVITEKKQLQWKEGCGPEMLEYCDIDDICEGDPVETGRIYLINTRNLKNRNFEELAQFLTSERSPYYWEYERLKAYYQGLVSLYSKPKCKYFRGMA